ncbi:hypothetical protein [Deinococcus hohokamensis]|uniref:Lipoprotein n=1 Tax=Deinococcus hohokamensis TaxID=309883 RepID=A0ABV9IAR8_9DEIO
MRILYPAFSLILAGCTLSPSHPGSFQAGQEWQVTGLDQDQALSVQVSTGQFREYQTSQRDLHLGSASPPVTVHMNQAPLTMLRLMWPGAMPLVARSDQGGEVVVVWNAGQVGAVYRCVFMDWGQPVTRLWGTLTRLDPDQDVALGSCQGRRLR